MKKKRNKQQEAQRKGEKLIYELRAIYDVTKFIDTEFSGVDGRTVVR